MRDLELDSPPSVPPRIHVSLPHLLKPGLGLRPVLQLGVYVYRGVVAKLYGVQDLLLVVVQEVFEFSVEQGRARDDGAAAPFYAPPASALHIRVLLRGLRVSL